MIAEGEAIFLAVLCLIAGIVLGVLFTVQGYESAANRPMGNYVPVVISVLETQ